MKVRFGQYLSAAFNARPFGMPVAPNWVGIAAFALLGSLNPSLWGLWIVGAGLELLYLFSLVNSRRFRRWVESRLIGRERKGWDARIDGLLARMEAAAQMRYRGLESKCRGILDGEETSGDATTRTALSETFGRLLWVYLQLLVTRDAVVRLLNESEQRDGRRGSVAERAAALQRRLGTEAVDDDLRRSLDGQLELLNQRLASQREARDKIDYIDSELVRIEEHVQLVREQAVLAQDPDAASQRIDAISSSLGNATQWIRDQQRLSGELSETLDEAPPPVVPVEATER